MSDFKLKKFLALMLGAAMITGILGANIASAAPDYPPSQIQQAPDYPPPPPAHPKHNKKKHHNQQPPAPVPVPNNQQF